MNLDMNLSDVLALFDTKISAGMIVLMLLGVWFAWSTSKRIVLALLVLPRLLLSGITGALTGYVASGLTFVAGTSLVGYGICDLTSLHELASSDWPLTFMGYRLGGLGIGAGIGLAIAGIFMFGLSRERDGEATK